MQALPTLPDFPTLTFRTDLCDMDHLPAPSLLHRGGLARCPRYCPFDRVPSEIIRIILPATFLSYHRHRSISKFQFPSVACRISRLFYEITMSTPILWSYLYLSPEMDMDLNLRHIDDRINSRSGVLQLDIFFTVGTGEPHHDLTIIDKVTSCSARWRRLCPRLCDQHVGDVEVRKQFVNLLHSPAPQLISLHMFTGVPNSMWHGGLLHQATGQLRQLRLHNCFLIWRNFALPSSLEELSVSERYANFVNPEEMVRVLDGSSLKSLSLVGVYLALEDLQVAEREVTLPPRCLLELLEDLELGSYTRQEITALLSIFDAPVLQRLSFQVVYSTYEDEKEDWDRGVLMCWEALRFRTLREITFGNVSLADGWLRLLLEKIPSSMGCLEIHYQERSHQSRLLDALQQAATRRFFGRVRHLRVSGIGLEDLLGMVHEHFTYLESLEVDVEYLDPFVDYGSEVEEDPLLLCLSGLVGRFRVAQDLLKPVGWDFCSLEDSHEGA